MARVDTPFTTALQAAALYIAEYGFDVYIFVHHDDEFYLQIVQTFISWLNCKMNVGWGRPADTTGWTVDQLCQWIYTYSVDLTTQQIPSQYYDIYTNCMEQMRYGGTIKRRSPYRINDADNYKQQASRTIFLSAVDCFKQQLKYHEITSPDLGYKSRGAWYNQSLSSGLDYYTYFMQETLRVLFGSPPPHTYPFTGGQTPNWCKECNRCEEWSYTPMDENDYIFTIRDKTLAAGTFLYKFKIKAEPDLTSPTPGDPNILKVIIGIQGLDENDDPTGNYYQHAFNPIGEGWVSSAFNFIVGPNTTRIYLAVECQNGAGQYLLSFRNNQIENSVSDLMYMLYGTEGDSFSWEVGSGDFAFKRFTSA